MKNYIYASLVILLFAFSCSEDASSFESGTLAGSYSTLLVLDSYLYGINDSELTTLDISDSDNPIVVDKQDVGFEIENLYHNDGVLFIGSKLALYVFTINQNGIPVRQSTTDYGFNSDFGICFLDPAISDGEYVYVTLAGVEDFVEACFTRQVNELRIYDAADITNPVLVSTTQLTSPKGLAKEGNMLFVCDSWGGVRVFDVTDKTAPSDVNAIEGIFANDIILKSGTMQVVGENILTQYDYSDINNIQFLSTIEF